MFTPDKYLNRIYPIDFYNLKGISFALPSNYAIEFLEEKSEKKTQSKNYYIGMKMVHIFFISYNLKQI